MKTTIVILAFLVLLGMEAIGRIFKKKDKDRRAKRYDPYEDDEMSC